MTSVKRPWAVWAGGWWGWLTAGNARYGSEEAAERAAWRRYPDAQTTLGYDVAVGRTDGGKPRKLSRDDR